MCPLFFLKAEALQSTKESKKDEAKVCEGVAQQSPFLLCGRRVARDGFPLFCPSVALLLGAGGQASSPLVSLPRLLSIPLCAAIVFFNDVTAWMISALNASQHALSLLVAHLLCVWALGVVGYVVAVIVGSLSVSPAASGTHRVGLLKVVVSKK